MLFPLSCKEMNHIPMPYKISPNPQLRAAAEALTAHGSCPHASGGSRSSSRSSDCPWVLSPRTSSACPWVLSPCQRGQQQELCLLMGSVPMLVGADRKSVV